MVNNDATELASAIDAACRITGEFTLRSGAATIEYFDKYQFETNPDLLLKIAEAIVPLLPPDTGALGGLELGEVPIATVVSQLTGLPTLFVRKEPKAYGTMRLAEGSDPAGITVTLIEDVITGGAVRNAAIALRDLGSTVHSVVCAIDRSEPGNNTLSSIGVETVSVLAKAQLDQARERSQPTG